MLKFLFFDNWGYESVEGFTRELQRPAKDPRNPLLTADRPWEIGNITLYGSVHQGAGPAVPALVQRHRAALASSTWPTPRATTASPGASPSSTSSTSRAQKTNIVFSANVHGPAIIYDEADPRPDWHYKMVCGADPTSHVYAYHSADGIHWLPRFRRSRSSPPTPIAPWPSCARRRRRRYAAHHRVPGGGRRIGRSESPDFIHWQGGRMVLEPGPGDPPQFQMYGMGATAYGDYEIGTLWDYHTDPEDTGRGKMRGYQEAEFTYSRTGFAWHRAVPRQPFIPHGQPGTWEPGNLQAPRPRSSWTTRSATTMRPRTCVTLAAGS